MNTKFNFDPSYKIHHRWDLFSLMDLRIFSLVLLFLLFPYFVCGPTKSRKIGGKNDLTPKPESIGDGYSTVCKNEIHVTKP